MRSRASKRYTAKGLLAASAVAALALVAPVAPAGATPLLEPTGSMATERYKAAAAPLPGGDALVVGGLHHVSLSSAESESLASAERYDGATGTFSPTGSMAVSRMDPTAAPLPDGSVLVLGGQVWGGGGTPLASAEIYDPASGEFTATGSMAVTRFGAMAAPLPDGRILVAGGYGSGSEASAEIYDPASGEFSPTGSMVSGRSFGIAAPLADGTVLIAAAGDGEDRLTTEIYDPLTEAFGIGSAETSRPLSGAGGSLDDGRVLFFSESRAGESTLEQTYEYDTAAGALVEPSGAPALTVERPAVAPLPGGRMLVAGGYSEDPHAYEGQGIVPFAAIYAEGPVPSGKGDSGVASDGTGLGAPAPASEQPPAGGDSATGTAATTSAGATAPRRPSRVCRRHATAKHGQGKSSRVRCAPQAKAHRKPAP